MIGEFVKFIETLKVQEILVVFALYLVFLWLLVPIWVFLDSKKKFDNIYLSILLFVLVLPLNIPGLLFYIIIRPNEFESMDNLSDSFNHFNVPVVNFVSDKNDLIMGIELKINGNILKPEIARDLNLTVNMDHSPEVEIKKVSTNNTNTARVESSLLGTLSDKINNTRDRIKERASRLKGMGRARLSSLRNRKATEEVKEETQTTVVESKKENKKGDKHNTKEVVAEATETTDSTEESNS